MGIGERRYTKEQTAAVIRACLDGPRRRSVPEVLREAALEGLPNADGERLEPFDAHVATLRRYVADELRKRRRVEVLDAGAGNAATALADRLAVVGDREVRRLENRSLQGKATADDVRSTAAMVKELAKLAREAGMANAPTSRRAAAGKDEPAPADPADTAQEAMALAAPQAPAPIV